MNPNPNAVKSTSKLLLTGEEEFGDITFTFFLPRLVTIVTAAAITRPSPLQSPEAESKGDTSDADEVDWRAALGRPMHFAHTHTALSPPDPDLFFSDLDWELLVQRPNFRD